MNRLKSILPGALLAVAGSLNARALAAQAATPVATTPAAWTAAAGSITTKDVSRRIYIIADDSMLGRDTPSRGLELTAQYVADQFKKFGLKPGGENGSWFQRYKIVRKKLDLAASSVEFVAAGEQVQVNLNQDARFVFGVAPATGTGGTALLLGGPFGLEDVKSIPAEGKVIVAVLDYSHPIAQSTQDAIGILTQTGATGLILVSNRDSTTFAQRVAAQGKLSLSVAGLEEVKVPVVEVHQRALGEVTKALGLDLEQIRSAEAPVVRELTDLQIKFDLTETVFDTASAPNTIGILEGTDPTLKNEYLVYSAHMDHIGISRPGAPDSIANGADDDGSGTIGVVELAEAFSQKGARPKRSILLMTVSGEEKGLWGSDYFTNHPTIPLSSLVADINIDMIGRNWPDTIVAIGREHSDLGLTLARVNEAHPELAMAAIDDRWPEEQFYFRSDHYNFARKGVPILFFFNGVHDDYHQVTDSPDKINAEKESRILKLLFYLGEDIANAPARPKWNPESYKQIVEEQDN